MTRLKKRGFTLVETLVTLATIGLLVALIVPALRGASEASRAATCSSNLRQMAMAAQSYANVWKDMYPAAILYKIAPDGLHIVAWDWELKPNGSVIPGPLWAHSAAPTEVLQCPSFEGSATFGNDPATGYNYNTTYIGAEGHFPEMDANGNWIDGWDAARRGLPAAAHRRPCETALFGDGGWKGGANKFMRAPSATVEGDLGIVYGGGQAFRHQGCTNCAYLDGHVRACTRCREGLLATQQLLTDVMDFPKNGFLSDDDCAYDPR